MKQENVVPNCSALSWMGRTCGTAHLCGRTNLSASPSVQPALQHAGSALHLKPGPDDTPSPNPPPPLSQERVYARCGRALNRPPPREKFYLKIFLTIHIFKYWKLFKLFFFNFSFTSHLLNSTVLSFNREIVTGAPACMTTDTPVRFSPCPSVNWNWKK